MPHGRLLIPLLVLAAAAGRAAAQADTAARPMPAGPAAGPCDSAPCPPTCAPPPRVRVIVPPPEVVFCAPANAPAKRGCGLFHHGQPCAAPCVPAAPCAAPCVAAPVAPVTPPGGGMVSFNMNMAMPYMTYQMTPMMMGSAGFAGAGMMGGGFGMPMGGMPMVLPAGGLNLGMGLGGGLQMSLGGNALAALGLGGAAGLSGGGTSALEMQLLRALLGGAAANGADAARPAPAPRAAEADAEAQMRTLRANVTAITTQITNELTNVQQMRDEMTLNTAAIGKLSTQLQAFEKRLDTMEKAAKKNGTE